MSICKRCKRYSVASWDNSRVKTAEVDAFHRLNAIASESICCGEEAGTDIIEFLGCRLPFDPRHLFLRGAFALAV